MKVSWCIVIIAAASSIPFDMTDTSQAKPATSTRKRRRRSRRQRRRFRKLSHWFKVNSLDIVGILFLLLGIALLIYPLDSLVRAPELKSELVRWFTLGSGAPLLGSGILVLAVLIGAIRVRWRINNHQPWWARRCPKCNSTHLSRIHRHTSDRLLNAGGIPVRRYTCRDCKWRGPRIDESQVRL